MEKAIEDIAESSKQALRAGERMARDIEALERRFERATDWRARLAEHRVWVAAGALACGVLLWRVLR